MLTEVDEGKGLVKTYWSNIRERVAKVEPTFAALVDKLNPDKTFPIYLAYFPYGALKGDTESSFLPLPDGGYYRLTDPDAPADVIKHLGYGKDSSPLGMVLDKQFEYYIDLKEQGITLPNAIYSPGAFFPLSRILSIPNRRVYAPNGLLNVTSGARSVFMLPNIGSATHHANLQRDFNVQSPPSKTLYSHWFLFKELLESGIVNSDWRSCIMYFSEKWVKKLFTDKAWFPLREYLLQLGWNLSEYQRNQVYYDIIFSIIQEKKNLKPNPYIADTARHLFVIALGEAPGFVPAIDDSALPLDVLQSIFLESYGLKKYHPTIMRPTHFSFEADDLPIYYSLQNPSTSTFSPKSRKTASTLFEIRELDYIVKKYLEELAKNKSLASDTVYQKLACEVDFKYYHNELDRHNIILPSSEMVNMDGRFNFLSKGIEKKEDARFAADAPFVRGCVGIQKKERIT